MLCETALGHHFANGLLSAKHRMTSKRFFREKLLSSVLDYALDYKLLIFQHEYFLVNTVLKGLRLIANSSSKLTHFTNNRSYCQKYWLGQRNAIHDLQRQCPFGHQANLFITLTSCGWQSTLPGFIREANNPTQYVTYLVQHYRNVLSNPLNRFIECGKFVFKVFNI